MCSEVLKLQHEALAAVWAQVRQPTANVERNLLILACGAKSQFWLDSKQRVAGSGSPLALGADGCGFLVSPCQPAVARGAGTRSIRDKSSRGKSGSEDPIAVAGPCFAKALLAGLQRTSRGNPFKRGSLARRRPARRNRRASIDVPVIAHSGVCPLATTRALTATITG